MKKCHQCGKYLEDSASYCSFCGAKTDGLEEEVAHDAKVINYKANYVGIFSLILALIPNLFSFIIQLIISYLNEETIINLLESPLGDVIAIVYLVGIVIALVLGIIGIINGIRKGGIFISILGLIISSLLLGLVIIQGLNYQDGFISYLRILAGVNIQ